MVHTVPLSFFQVASHPRPTPGRPQKSWVRSLCFAHKTPASVHIFRPWPPLLGRAYYVAYACSERCSGKLTIKKALVRLLITSFLSRMSMARLVRCEGRRGEWGWGAVNLVERTTFKFTRWMQLARLHTNSGPLSVRTMYSDRPSRPSSPLLLFF